MPDPGAAPGEGATRPILFTIPTHRSFADALVNGLLAQHGSDTLSLAQGMILVPNNRAGRSIADAFVRRAEAGLLLPRIVAVGDAGEAPGLAIDDASEPVQPAVEPLTRDALQLAEEVELEFPVFIAVFGLDEVSGEFKKDCGLTLIV